MMLSHQQMGHEAAKTVGEYDSSMANFDISQDCLEIAADGFAVSGPMDKEWCSGGYW